MKVTVDKSACIGCGACEAVCPQVFRLGNDGLSEVLPVDIGPELAGEVWEAANGCPVSAIHIEE